MTTWMKRAWCVAAGVGLLALTSGSVWAQAPADSAAARKVRIVGCDEQVQSHKRGVAANELKPEDFRALAPGVSWWYNWYFEPKQTPPAGVSFEFVPMVWGDKPEYLEGLKQYLAAGHRPRAVLAINEPNLKDQAYISPERTAELYKKIKAVADRYGIAVSGPQMALGSGADSSITAMDPIEHKQVTYTYMVPFVKAVLAYLPETKVPSIGYHVYGNMGEFRWAVGEMHKQFERPLWVTEYAWWGAPSMDEEKTYLMQATDLLERSPDIEAYAWFKERADNPKISLLEKEPGKLSVLGQAYVALPVHDADVYYRLPGRLDAEKYVTMTGAEIYPTTDADGLADMAASDDQATLTYQVVAPAGGYAVTVRVSGAAGKVELLKGAAGDEVLATVMADGAGWQTLPARVQFEAGPQTLRVRLARGMRLNWVEFAAE